MSLILVVEDDLEIAGLVRIHLLEAGYEVEHARSAEEALERLASGRFDLVVLDVGLPGRLDGIEMCRRLRQRSDATPIVMLTARSDEVDRVLGLELGADDYVTKPFSVRELVARVNAVQRRVAERSAQEHSIILADGLRVDTARHEVTLDGRTIELTPREFDLLLWFVRHPERVYSREELLEHVWGYGHDGYAHTVNSHINRLRAKIERDPRMPEFILTVWGVGYKFSIPQRGA